MFLTNLQAAASTDAGNDFWYQPLAGPTVSGAVVTTDSALRLSTVYKCVKVIAESLSMLPVHLYRSMGSQRERVRQHPVAQLLATRPNPWQTPQQFRLMMEAHRTLRGNAYAEIFYNAAGEPTDLIPLHPDRVTPEVAANGLPRYIVRSANNTGATRTLVPGEILHLTGLCLDGYTGLNPIAAQREAVGNALAARDYGSRFWHNDARPPFWVEVPGQFKNGEAAESLRDQWQAKYGGANRGRPAMLDQGMKIHELGVSNHDAQWIDARKYSDVDICGLYRLPPHKIGILDRATWGNIEQQNIEFVTDCLLPLAVSWEQTIARDLLTDPDEYVEHVMEQLLRGDTTTRYAAYSKAITDGWITRNEVRALENRNPLPGLDEPLQQANMVPTGSAARMAALGGPGSPSGAGRNPARAVSVLAASVDRVVRKELRTLETLAQRGPATPADVAAAFDGHAHFVAQALALPEPVAQAYVDAMLPLVPRVQIAKLGGPISQAARDDWTTQQTAALLHLEG